MSAAMIGRLTIQICLLTAGVAVIWMLGSPRFSFDPQTKSTLITGLGMLVTAAATRLQTTEGKGTNE